MDEILMSPDVCMRFLIWSYYYHGIIPSPAASYVACGRFADADARKLDQLQEALFKCFEEASVRRACLQFARAKELGEPCPFPQDELDLMFAAEKPQHE